MDITKDIFLTSLIRFIDKYHWELFEWVILDNHYHFLAKVAQSKDMPIMINSLHKTSAFHIMKELNIQIKPFWYQYWDRCIRNDKDYYRTAMYILYNPIKHGYVSDLKVYPYSSFHKRFKEDEAGLKANFLRHNPQSVKDYEGMDDF